MTAGAEPPRPTDARPAPDDLVTVRLLGLPVPVQARAQQQSDELTRELTLVAEQLRQQGDHGALPVRLVSLVEQLSGAYSMFTGEQEQQLAAAIQARADTIDLTYRVPASAAGGAEALGKILDEADEYCRAGRHLLTLAASPELVTYRWWFLDQFIDQAAGRPAVTWSRYSASGGSTRASSAVLAAHSPPE